MPKRRVARKGGWHGDSAGHRRAALKGRRHRSARWITLYHKTSTWNAADIMRQGFRPGHGRPVYLTTRKNATQTPRVWRRNSAALRVVLPKSRLTKDIKQPRGKGETWYTAPPKLVNRGRISRAHRARRLWKKT